MKNITIIISLLLFLGLSSCQESTTDVYPVKADLFFHYSLTAGPWDADDQKPTYVRDSTIVRFGYDEILKEDSIIRMKMRLIGPYADFDRPINFVLVDSMSTAKLGEDIELLYDESFMLANDRTGYIYVKLKNTEKLRNTELIAAIRTAPNEYFIAKYDSIQEGEKHKVSEKTKSNTFRIRFNCIKDKPNLWAANELKFKQRGFGDYSNVKLDFIMEQLHLDYEYFTYDPSAEDPDVIFSNRFPIGLINGWKIVLELALEKYERDHGAPMKDENGNNVLIGNYKPSSK